MWLCFPNYKSVFVRFYDSNISFFSYFYKIPRISYFNSYRIKPFSQIRYEMCRLRNDDQI